MTLSEALREIKAILQEQYAETDAAQRSGSQNFICLALDIDHPHAFKISDHVERAIRQATGGGTTLFVHIYDVLKLDAGSDRQRLCRTIRAARFYWLDHAILATSDGEPLPPLPSKADLQILWERAK